MLFDFLVDFDSFEVVDEELVWVGGKAMIEGRL